MPQDFDILIKTELKEKDVDKVVEKIKKRFEIRVFDKSSGDNKRLPTYRIYTEAELNKIVPDIYLCFFDKFQTYKLTNEMIIHAKLEHRYWNNFDKFLDFVGYLCKETNSKQFIGHIGGSDWVTLIGTNTREKNFSEFKRYLANYSKLYKLKNIPSEDKLKELIQKQSVEKELVGNFEIYYLLPKEGEIGIFSGKIPEFYKQFMEGT